MISFSTAKLLLFIALLVGPKVAGGGHTIEVVNKNYYCTWTQDATGWNLVQSGQTSNHWPENQTNLAPCVQPVHNPDFVVASEVTRHNWNVSENSKLYLQNGNLIEKQGTKVFYITNPGAANQEVYTILTMKDGKEL